MHDWSTKTNNDCLILNPGYLDDKLDPGVSAGVEVELLLGVTNPSPIPYPIGDRPPADDDEGPAFVPVAIPDAPVTPVAVVLVESLLKLPPDDD